MEGSTWPSTHPSIHNVKHKIKNRRCAVTCCEQLSLTQSPNSHIYSFYVDHTRPSLASLNCKAVHCTPPLLGVFSVLSISAYLGLSSSWVLEYSYSELPKFCLEYFCDAGYERKKYSRINFNYDKSGSSYVTVMNVYEPPRR